MSGPMKMEKPPPIRWQSVFIVGFLLVQILAPVGYYQCREDPHDERFAWRMFSPERMTTCAPRFFVGDGSDREQVRLSREFHQAWIETARRGRIEVIRRMALHLCDEHPSKPVRVEVRCKDVSDEVFELTEPHDVCLMGSIQ